VKATSPNVFSTGAVTSKLSVRKTDPGAFVVGGASTIGGAGGATVEVEDSFAAIVVAVGATPRVGSTKPGFLAVIDFFPLPETVVVDDSPTTVVEVAA
jgi:hypothetical protein